MIVLISQYNSVQLYKRETKIEIKINKPQRIEFFEDTFVRLQKSANIV